MRTVILKQKVNICIYLFSFEYIWEFIVPNCVKSVNYLYFTGHPTGRRKSAIPEKIAQIAKSMYDRDNLGFGDLPRGNKPRKY